jgi:hypothetical protein
VITNNVIQADLIAAMKADASLVAALGGSADNIKESQYAGKNLGYPAVRLYVAQQIPIPERIHCDHARLNFSIRVFAEGGSSKPADELAGYLLTLFHDSDGGMFFRGTGWYSMLRNVSLIGAVRTGDILWQSDSMFAGVVYPTA